MIDFHCHIDLFPNPEEILAGIAERGCRVLAVTTTPVAWQGNLHLVGSTHGVRLAVGLHPELVVDRYKEIDQLFEIIHKTQYVGEIGLDGSPAHRKSLPIQIDVFRRILSLCEHLGGRVLSIHSRGASKEVLKLLNVPDRCSTPVLHWFTGRVSEVKIAAEYGCWFSVGPAMLKSKNGFSLISAMPRDRIITESDGPFTSYLPWEIQSFLGALSVIWNCSLAEANKQIARNFRSLVGDDFEDE